MQETNIVKTKSLRNYQLTAIDFIKEKKKCALYLDMGLGKTISTLTTIQQLLDEFAITKVLIIAPLLVANNVWHSEIAQWDHVSHLKYSICTGTEKERLAALNIEADIYIINRENVQWLHSKKYTNWDMIVLDESSSFKNPSSKRFKYLKGFYKKNTEKKGYSEVKGFNYEYMIQLSGTPSPNGLLDLWSQIYLLDQGKRLGKTMSEYKTKFFTSDYNGFIFTPKKSTAIYNLISDISLSMKAQDYLELPPRIDLFTYVDIEPLKQYNELKKEFITIINNQDFLISSAAVLFNKLLQFCNGAIYDESKNTIMLNDNKLNALETIIENNANENILVAYNFKSDLERLKARFKDAVIMDKNKDVKDQWNKGEIRLLLCHPASCGKGLNLQAGGNIIIWFGISANYEDYVQFNARLHRQGQLKPVIINHIFTKNGMDELTYKLKLCIKDTNQKNLLEALKYYYK